MKNNAKLLPFVLGVVLGGFFVYKGLTKHWLSACKVYGPESTIPLEYQQVITAFCQAGFLKLIGALQIIFGLMLIFNRTRLMGAIMMLPLILNIFLIHLFLDNRPEELVETGIPMAINIAILAIYYPKWKGLLGGSN